MTALQQTILVWLAVFVVTPIALYVCRAGERRRAVEQRYADAHRRAVMLRHSSAGSFTEDDALRLRMQLEQLPTADEPEVRK